MTRLCIQMRRGGHCLLYVWLTKNTLFIFLINQTSSYCIWTPLAWRRLQCVVVNSSLGMATPGCQSSPEFTSIGRDWAEEVKRKNGRPAPSQVPQSTLRSDFQVSWRIWLGLTQSQLLQITVFMAYLTLFCRKFPKNSRKKSQRSERGGSSRLGQIPNFYRKFVLQASLIQS